MTADEGDCPGHTFTGTAINGARIYVESGTHNVTFSGLNITASAEVGIAPGVTMNLTIEGTNTISAATHCAGIYVPVGATLVINGTGSLNVSGSGAGAGIGGAAYAPDEDGSDGDPNCGTVEIKGGTVTATGGGVCAGIGGGKTDYVPGNGGTVTINGGTVTATGGSDNYYGGAGIGGAGGVSNEWNKLVSGNGGTLTINGGTVNLTAGTHNSQYPAYGFGQGSGDASGGTCELTLADESYLDSSTTLDPKGKYTINGDPTADMIVVPTDLIYNGNAQELDGKIYIDDSKTGSAEHFGRTFAVKASADGWTYTIDPAEVKAAGDYTVTFSKEGHTSISKTFTVAQSGTQFVGDGEIKTYNGDTLTTSFSAGDTITVKATPTATGAAPTNGAMLAASFAEPAAGQMAVFVGDTQVSEPATASDGTYTMTVSASDVLLAAGDPGNVTLTAKFVGTANMADAMGTVNVTISAAAKAEIGSAVIGYYDASSLSSAFDAENTGATVTLLDNVELASTISIYSGTFTLDLNGYSISCTNGNAIYLESNLTICGNGNVTSNVNTVIVGANGTLTLEGGTYSSSHPEGVGVQVGTKGALNVTGAGVEISILDVQGNSNVSLTAGTYSRIGISSTKTLAGLLGTDKHYAYYKANGAPILLSDLEGQTELTGPVTVQACDHTGAEATNNGDGTHRVNCPYCGYTSADEPHSFNETGLCPACKLQAAAKVEKSGSDTIYVEASGLADVFAENSGNDGATITLLDNITTSKQITVGADNLTLDLNGKTYTCTQNDFYLSFVSLTIKGSGAITTSGYYCLAMNGGTLNIESGSFSAGESAVYVENNGTLQLTGGSFTGGQSTIAYESGEVTAALKNYGKADAPHYAFYQGSSPYTPSGKSLPSGTFTVGTCEHDGVKPTSNNDGTHALKCPYCGYRDAAANCAYVFSGTTGTCATCGDSVTVAVSGTENLTYDGTGKEPGVTVTRGETALTAGTDYTVAYSNNKNAGTATVTVTIGSGAYTQDFTIGKATPTITWGTTTQELTFTGQQAAITAPTVALVNNENFGGTISYSYATQGGTEFKDGLPTNAGTYTIKASIAAQGNYTAAESTNTLALTIKPSPVTLTFNNQTITYGGTPTGATASPASAEIKYSYTTEADGTPISGWPTNAGTYTVTAKVEATGNYGEASKTATLTINPKEVSNPTIELSPSSFVYDGTGKEPAVTVKDGEKVIPASEYTVGYSSNINAGTAAVTITNVAGNYTVNGTKTFTISAKPLAGAKVEVTGTFTYTGNALTPAPTVTLGGETLTENTDYTVAYASNTNAGTATITVTGKGNYSGTAQGTFTIGRATLTADGTGTASGTYGDKLSELTVSGLTAKLGEATVTGTWKLAGGTVPNVGDSGEYTATFTPATGADNYNALTAQVTLNIAKADYSGTTTASTSAKFGATGTYDLSALLPDGATAGTAATTSDIFEGAPTVSGKTLSYTLKAGATLNSTGTITVPVTSTNYNDFDLTITVTVTDKDVPTLTVSPITVTYTGQAIPANAIQGTAKVGDAIVPGTWAFASGEAVTNVADSGTKTVKFVPSDKDTYAEATGTVVVTINKATPTGVPKYTAISASGKTLVDAGLTTEGGTFSTGGTVAWTLDNTTEVTANTQYEWTFTPTDTANYNTLTGKITLWPYTTPVNPGGGGGYVPSDPGGSTLPVTTTGQGSTTTTTTTTAAPTASVSNGTATTTINTAMGQEIVRQATANKSENVVIAPSVTGSVTKAEVSIPASTVGQIGSQTNASLTVSTPVADVTIPNGGLGSLSSAGGTVTVTAEQVGNSVELTVTAGGRTVQNVPGGVTLTVPAASTTPGTVAVLVHPDGTREVVRKSVADNGAVTIPLDGSAKLEIVDNSKYFADVPATSWAADAVAFASAHELFGGTGANQFSPDLPMSRGMLAVVLHNLESNPAQALTGAFADVDNSQWYAEGVAWAEAQGIIGGYGNGRFGPNDNITREQLAVMLWRYSGSPAATDRELHFADAHRASDWALDALRWATENGIINGKGGGILDPTGQATRAEAAQMLKNFMEDR